MKGAGFDISYTTVCLKIREKRAEPKEAFIAQTYPYGSRFEYDFGEVVLYIGGKRTTVLMAVMTAPASGYRFAVLYYNQKQDVFIDSQIKFFEHMGGTFESGVYDNMRNAVARFVGREKELNPTLVQFALYYGFSPRTTNCYAGNEKGSVESAVKVVRQQTFATHWEFDSLADAQIHLDSILEKLNADKAIDKEHSALRQLPPTYEFADIRAHCAVDKYSCVRIDHVSYSVPDVFVGKYLTVKLYPLDVVIVHKGSVIASHKRSFEAGGFVLDINHFIPTFKRKPGALEHSRVLQANAELKEIFDKQYKDNPREFISILERYREKPFDTALFALKHHIPEPEYAVDAGKDYDPIAIQTLSQIALIGKPKERGLNEKRYYRRY